jgi:hypothetical protein
MSYDIIHAISIRRTDVKLYHGTNYSSAINIITNGIDLSYSKPYLDFGAGFYTTPSIEHAEISAIRATRKYNAQHGTHDVPCVVRLNYVPTTNIKLSIISFPRHSPKWGAFVLNNRLTPEILNTYNILEHNQDARYDVCCGEIADGSIANIAYKVNNKILKPSQVNYNDFIKTFGRDYPQQYSFHTSNAISCINVISYDIILEPRNQKGRR